MTAAERGHDVTLYDGASEIGGQLNIAKKVPGKQEFEETLRYFRRQVELTGVKLRLGTRVDAQALGDAGFDEIVLATGVVPRMPAIDGVNHPKVMSYLDVLRDGKPVGGMVAVIGAGGIGFDVAVYLAEPHEAPSLDRFFKTWGVDVGYSAPGGTSEPEVERSARQVIVLQRSKGKPGDKLGKTTGWIHRAALKARGVAATGDAVYRRIDDEGLHVTIAGEDKLIPADNVVICAGQEPLRDLYDALKAKGCTVHLIGGADVAAELDAKRAIDRERGSPL